MTCTIKNENFTELHKKHKLGDQNKQRVSIMNLFPYFLFLLSLSLPSVQAQEDAYSYMDEDIHPGETLHMEPQDLQGIVHTTESQGAACPAELDDNDPWEGMNRGIFAVNSILDDVLFDPIAGIYKFVFPDFFRERVGYVLRNLSEPIVLVNNVLQGEMGDAEDTLRRFLINSTVGVGGIFDVSTDLDIPYKREDFGLTLASWGFGSGPYLVLPILGPSSLRDTFGRIGDYGFDPLNWWAYFDDQAFYSYTRTGVQILDAKTDNIAIIAEIKKDALDDYLAFREWYLARRQYLATREVPSTDTPHPDAEEDGLELDLERAE